MQFFNNKNILKNILNSLQSLSQFSNNSKRSDYLHKFLTIVKMIDVTSVWRMKNNIHLLGLEQARQTAQSETSDLFKLTLFRPLFYIRSMYTRV